MNSLVNISIDNELNIVEIEKTEPLVSLDVNNVDTFNIEVQETLILIDNPTPELVITEISNTGISQIDTSNIITGEVPSGSVNGINATFTSSFSFVPSSLEVFLNGLRQKILDDYNTSGTNTILFNVSPTISETILINYIKI